MRDARLTASMTSSTEKAVAVAAVQHLAPSARPQIIKRRDVGARQIADVDVVPYKGSVRRRVVVAERL